MSSDDIYNSLDLLWSDGYEGDNVRTNTIADRGPVLEAAIALLDAEETVNFSLLIAFKHKHPSPQIYALDFPSDARGSFYLLLGGYYKQAILCLRNWLEMRLLGIYFGLVDGSKYDDWKKGSVTEQDRLYGIGLINRIFGRAEFHKAHARTGVREHG